MKYELTPPPNDAGLQPWERLLDESEPAWQAFETFRTMGGQRRLVGVADKCGKHVSLIERWAKRHGWHQRVLAFDRYEARVTTERILLGTASMRERQIVLSMQLQSRAQQRLLRMSESEVNQLRPVELVALLKASAAIETKAREVSEDEMSTFNTGIGTPVFEVQIIRPGKGMVPVQLTDGRYGYIPESEIERFQRDYPSAVIIR